MVKIDLTKNKVSIFAMAGFVMFIMIFAVIQVGLASMQTTNEISGTEGLDAMTSHLIITGDTQGLIEGDSTIDSLYRKNTQEIVQFSHSFYDAVSGTGHTPFYVTKRIDKSSPQLLMAMDTKELLQIEMNFYRPNPAGDGTTELYYKIQLKDAIIVSFQSYKKDTLSPDTATLPDLEEIGFKYTSIIYSYMETGAEYELIWNNKG